MLLLQNLLFVCATKAYRMSFFKIIEIIGNLLIKVNNNSVGFYVEMQCNGKAESMLG